ncbi:putative Diguanylate cyclase [Candidatus Desulfosporosinus infrequens]|uniref:Putative Diguanylate cyclase n=1 Tax=Candidatus Desulfosporosinus infrequens TaxID=2043169 RepID=A0A2U3K3Y0_9FIRM|nr:putative Diguanylate cyclase [Candidatus Desulfosporosinus infrequens]
MREDVETVVRSLHPVTRTTSFKTVWGNRWRKKRGDMKDVRHENMVTRPEIDPAVSSWQVLRRKGVVMERRKATKSLEGQEVMSTGKTWLTIHELRVHQIELEMQIEELRRAQAELDDERERYFDLYDLAPVAYCTISEKGLITETNLAATNLLGVVRGALCKQPISQIILKEDQYIYYLFRKKLNDTGKPQECELRMIKIDETVFWAHLVAIVVHDTDGAQVCRIALTDITERKKKEAEIFYIGYHDQLTGLFNRRFYEEELKRLDTERNFPLTIVMGDVNGLKLINDSFGHVMGDVLLMKVAEVITAGCRTDDIIARLGGDEFVMLLPKTNASEAELIIKRIKALAGKEKIEAIDISIAFGYEVKNNMEIPIQEIFEKAEDHMYRQKLIESEGTRGSTINV